MVGERLPGARGEGQRGAGRVLAVADGDGAAGGADLDAGSSVAAAVGALAPEVGDLDAVAAVVAAVAALAPHVGDLDAGSAVVAAVAAFAPCGAGHVHTSSATFLIRSRDAPQGRASARSLSKRSAT